MSFRLILLSIRPGNSRNAAWDAEVGDYLQRCGREWVAEPRVMRSEAMVLDWVADQRKLGACALWLADLNGRTVDTESFTGRLRAVRESGLRNLILGIGPANGWSEAARSSADFRFSMSAMTFPHELARLVLAEQVYRAVSILQGHPYHRGH